MKKQNKTYLSLAERGITKAWDKAVIFKVRKTEKMQMVIYYKNKPIYYWPVENAFDVAALKDKINAMLYLYNGSTLNQRKTKKAVTRYFIMLDAGERVITYRRGREVIYKRGGDLFPSLSGV